MGRVVALGARVLRLERARAPRSPFVSDYGSLAAFDASVRADVASGLLDQGDVLGVDGKGGVLAAILRWHRDGVW